MTHDLCRYANRPFAFIGRYVRRRAIAHFVILSAVVGAVACSVGTQYGLKYLIDTLSEGPRSAYVMSAFIVLAALISADMLLWRFAGWVGSFTFVGVTGDLRRELFRHLTGHAPTYFLERPPGVLTSRVTATSNAVFMIEQMTASNVLPPCIATVGAIIAIMTVSLSMAAVLIAVAGVVIVVMFRLAAAGKPLHYAFADKAAAVDGEMVDVVGNIPLVRSFCGLGRELARFDNTVDRELNARQRSLLYLEKLRLFHAVVTVVLTIGLLGWAIALWQSGAATTGDVVLVCTLGLTVLHATRDLAVALVDVTQHVARLARLWPRFSFPMPCAITTTPFRSSDATAKSPSRTSRSPTPTGDACSRTSASVSRRASVSASSGLRVSASPRCSPCSSGSTIRKAAAS